jgi:hypothetical protein
MHPEFLVGDDQNKIGIVIARLRTGAPPLARADPANALHEQRGSTIFILLAHDRDDEKYASRASVDFVQSAPWPETKDEMS